jgi:hypothetical protein
MTRTLFAYYLPLKYECERSERYRTVLSIQEHSHLLQLRSLKDRQSFRKLLSYSRNPIQYKTFLKNLRDGHIMACQNCEFYKYTPLFGINTSDKVLRHTFEKNGNLSQFSILDLFLAPENILKLAPRTLEETQSTQTAHTALHPTQHTTIHHSFN